MHFSLAWIQEIFNTSLTSSFLENELTKLGLEVDAIEILEPSFKGLIVAKVIDVKPHPDADRLKIATVFDGEQELQVVCGAANCRANLVTAFAPINSHLIDKEGKAHKIKKGKLRGIESYGMLCSAEELGMEENSEGIIELSEDLEPGEDLAPYLRDEILEISFTPNLGHAMSVLGIAREISCLINKPFELKSFPLNETKNSRTEDCVNVKVSDANQCPRYACRLIKNVTIRPSPFWLQMRLSASGIKSINNVVDATNYILHELGHPIHAFDFNKIEGAQINVKSFPSEQEFETLDNIQRNVPAGTLFICDSEKPLAIAGVMGGANSQVSDKTQHVLLEAAVFSPQLIRKTSKSLNLSTDASKHFERGVDEKAPERVLDRAASLIQQIAHGEVCEGVVALSKAISRPKSLQCDPSFINRLLGTQIPLDEMIDILHRLDFNPQKNHENKLTVQVPSYRNDVQNEIDLVEEVARFYGFDRIMHAKPSSTFTSLSDSPLYTFEQKAHQFLLQEGLQEILTCDLISPQMASLQQKEENQISALNYVSIDQSILRNSLLANHLQVLKLNQDRQNFNNQLYEIGKVYSKNDSLFQEETKLAVSLMGRTSPLHFQHSEKKVDFLDLKGILENVLDRLSIKEVVFEKSHHAFMHPGIQANLVARSKIIGSIGEIHPSILRTQGLKDCVLFAELSIPSLLTLSTPLESIEPLSNFPSSERDWTLTCLEDLEIGHLITFVKSLESRLLKQIELKDIYRSESLGVERKNVTLRFVYRNDKKTISFEATEIEHAKIMNEVLKKMKNLIVQPF
ncbi:MAG: Phenylalanine--tRNA ligase beta subunit [Chlamydiae bacterium]|nr:Phenylalanine--tRNA ligase beta subunit [Chlamydiota bacterium]